MTNLKALVLDPELTPFERLIRLMEILRSPEGCNWDKKQTHESLIPYLLEEAYEVVEVIEDGNYGDLREELGDLLMQVVFHAQLAKERGDFTIDDAVNDEVTKLVNRHPHVFETRRDLKPQEVRDQWEKIKTESGEKPSVLGGLPRTMPALTMAFRLGEKAGGVGFDWNEPEEVLEKIEEEVREIRTELAAHRVSQDRLSDEIGDLLFATASLSRKLAIDPEISLRKALDKFRSRFGKLEDVIREAGNRFDDYTLDELEAIWQSVKQRK
jgi:tetrapyrrole methylase family protein/MazG family protein